VASDGGGPSCAVGVEPDPPGGLGTDQPCLSAQGTGGCRRYGKTHLAIVPDEDIRPSRTRLSTDWKVCATNPTLQTPLYISKAGRMPAIRKNRPPIPSADWKVRATGFRYVKFGPNCRRDGSSLWQSAQTPTGHGCSRLRHISYWQQPSG
jgi:hypothetical protein